MKVGSGTSARDYAIRAERPRRTVSGHWQAQPHGSSRAPSTTQRLRGYGSPAPSGRRLFQPGAWYDRSTSTGWSGRLDLEDQEIRAALDRHWAASDANDFEGSTRFTERTRCSNIRNRASVSAGGGTFSRLAPRSRTGNASQCGG